MKSNPKDNEEPCCVKEEPYHLDTFGPSSTKVDSSAVTASPEASLSSVIRTKGLSYPSPYIRRSQQTGYTTCNMDRIGGSPRSLPVSIAIIWWLYRLYIIVVTGRLSFVSCIPDRACLLFPLHCRETYHSCRNVEQMLCQLVFKGPALYIMDLFRLNAIWRYS